AARQGLSGTGRRQTRREILHSSAVRDEERRVAGIRPGLAYLFDSDTPAWMRKGKGKGGRGMRLPQAPAMGPVTEATGTMHGLIEFAQMMMRPMGKDDKKMEDAIDEAANAVGTDDGKGLRGNINNLNTQIAQLNAKGLQVKFA